MPNNALSQRALTAVTNLQRKPEGEMKKAKHQGAAKQIRPQGVQSPLGDTKCTKRHQGKGMQFLVQLCVLGVLVVRFVGMSGMSTGGPE